MSVFVTVPPTVDRQSYGTRPNPDAEWLESVRNLWKAFVTDVKNELDPVVGELAVGNFGSSLFAGAYSCSVSCKATACGSCKLALLGSGM